jgi:predicted acylesterase/phospholipase RssA
MIQSNPKIQTAEDILRGRQASPAEILALATVLKNEKYFGYARRLLFRARQDSTSNSDPRLATKLRQQHALCTYKDPDLPTDLKFDRALEILTQCEDLNITTNQETLGLAGAIYKNKWEAFGQRADLERSLAYYTRGYAGGIAGDYGYTAINTAFVLDVIADQEMAESRSANASSDSAAGRTAEARRIRKEIVTQLPPLAERSEHAFLKMQWWFYATVAEALFGLERYREALPPLLDGKSLPDVHEWELESTARQLASLARLVGSAQPGGDLSPEAREVLEQFLGTASGVTTAYIGKVGLALSGGGFRAALFHIGVLARLAELDVLRHVEVLSCVSGGSIIGAYYYLELRQLLQSKAEDEITRQDYIEIMQRIQREFLAGIQRNIRTRVLGNPVANIRMLLFPNASRSERVGALYEKHLFSRVNDGLQGEARWINDMTIHPKGEEPGFSPKSNNWRRRVKAPILILNATTLNTGHNWQFTATWMGEPPAGIDSEIDANYRLRRMYYYEAPEAYRKYRLGNAVAASSCVPGLFEPINLPDLFAGKTVRLVDGGVHDNQGITALLEQGCSLLLVSDASGQMEDQSQPGNSALSALLRSNSILQSRVREAEYHELDARRRSSLLRGMMFLHLKKDLDTDPVDWINCEDPVDASDEARPSIRRGDLTYYGIRKDVQRLLAAIRTDLDSFHEVEAYALMTSGYRMTEAEFPSVARNFRVSNDPAAAWQFLGIEEPMKRISGVDAAHRELVALLAAANSLAFKIWKLSRPLKYFGWVLIFALVAATGWACVRWRNYPLLTPGRIGIAALVAALTALIGNRLVRIIRYKDTVRQIAIGVGMGILGWIAAAIHVLIFDRMYLRRGRLRRIEKLQGKPKVQSKGMVA